jgi:phthalate 4,5-cis-dihydrodiol dehydrogenase
MALTLQECDAIIAAAEHNKVQLIVGHTHAYDPAIRVIHQLISHRALGKLGMINCFNYTDFLYRPRRPEELDTALGGGILFNQLPHQIDIARLLGGGLVRGVRAQTTVLDPSRPTEGSCIAFLQFEDGAAASLIYSAYDYFDSDEWHYWITERGAPKSPARGAARRALMQAKDEARLRTEKYAYGVATGELPPYQPHFGLTIATCANGDLRTSPNGVMKYDIAGSSEIKIERGEGMPGRREVLDDMSAALRHSRRRPVHDGRWGKATVEVALAIQQSAREQREITLHHQVPVPAPIPGPEDEMGEGEDTIVSARIVDDRD